MAELSPDTLPDGHRRTVAATWSLSIERADSHSPEGAAPVLGDPTEVLRPSVARQHGGHSGRAVVVGLLAPLGRLVIYGAAGGEPGAVPASLYALRSIVGFSLLAWRAARPELARADVTDVAEHAAAGRLRTVVHARLPLTEAAEAHRILEGREQLGRVLLVP